MDACQRGQDIFLTGYQNNFAMEPLGVRIQLNVGNCGHYVPLSKGYVLEDRS
jgi:hypothetical protein